MNLKQVSTSTMLPNMPKDSHVVQGRTDVSHETHEEEWQLQHRVLEEIQSIDDFVVPSRALQVCEQSKESDKHTNSKGL